MQKSLPETQKGMASMKASRNRGTRSEYWIFDRIALLRVDGRPLILKNRKTAERFVSEMGMSGDWNIEERPAPVRETRGRKSMDDPGIGRARLAWAMMKPKERPTRYDGQRRFVERFRGPLAGSPTKKRKVVRAFMKQIQRLHEKAQANPSIDKLLST